MKLRVSWIATPGARAAGWGAAALLCIAGGRLLTGAPYAVVFFGGAVALAGFALSPPRRAVGLAHILDSDDPVRLLPLLGPPPGWGVDARGQHALRIREGAVALTLLGRFDGARHLLGKVDWLAQDSLVRSAGLFAEALLDLLETHDFGRARNLIRRAIRAEEESEVRMPPGSRSELHACELAADLLSGDASRVEALEECARSEQLVEKLLAHWGLGTHFWWEEERDRAQEHFAACAELAPRCEPLQRAPPVPRRAG